VDTVRTPPTNAAPAAPWIFRLAAFIVTTRADAVVAPVVVALDAFRTPPRAFFGIHCAVVALDTAVGADPDALDALLASPLRAASTNRLRAC
jgi:hypothetical protein